MSEHFPSLIVTFPLMMAFLTYIFGIFSKKLVYPLTLFTAIVCVLMNLKLFMILLEKNSPIHYFLGGWEPPWGIEYVMDYLNVPLLCSISIIFLLLTLLTKELVRTEIGKEKMHLFYALILLQYTGLQGVTATGDAFNLYVLIEIMSFSAYGIVALGRKGAEFFAFRYMIIGTIGACFYLLGVGHIYILTGSLNLIDLSKHLPLLSWSYALISGVLFLIVGILIKMAFFPFHVWLPDAYSYSPASVSAYLAPLSTKVAAYVLIRLIFLIVTPVFGLKLRPVFDFLGILSAIAIMFGALMAIAQKEIRRSLCYIVLSEIAYVVIAISAMNEYGFKGAILHIINDMFMISCLFCVWCLVYLRTGNTYLDEWKGLNEILPYTMVVFVICALSIIGVPPLCGFFSKWYILLGLLAQKKWLFSAVVLASGLLNVVYFLRLIEKAYFFGKDKKNGGLNHKKREKTISIENSCLYILAFFLLFLGISSNYLVENIINNALPKVFFR